MTRTLRALKVVVLTAIVLLIVAAGVWMSWQKAQHIVLTKGRERGTMTVTACGNTTCTGPYLPDDTAKGGPRANVTIDKSVTRHRPGEKIPVAIEPGTSGVVRTGWAGGLHAWVPLGGSCLLAAVVAAGGLRSPRVAWVLGLSGAGLLIGAFVAV